MFNAQSFGTTDPQFGLDNGFYVFVLPEPSSCSPPWPCWAWALCFPWSLMC